LIALIAFLRVKEQQHQNPMAKKTIQTTADIGQVKP